MFKDSLRESVTQIGMAAALNQKSSRCDGIMKQDIKPWSGRLWDLPRHWAQRSTA